jgi:hypothetical protein
MNKKILCYENTPSLSAKIPVRHEIEFVLRSHSNTSVDRIGSSLANSLKSHKFSFFFVLKCKGRHNCHNLIPDSKQYADEA